MSESKASRRSRPVAANGDPGIIPDDAPRSRRFLLIGGVWLLAIALAVAAAMQWREGWTTSLPHQGPDRPPLALAAQPNAPAAASPVPTRALDPTATKAALAAVLGAETGLGPHVGVSVADLTNAAHFTEGNDEYIPASTMKLLTAAAAFATLGAQYRFSTTVRLDGSRLILIGGGDPLLTAKEGLNALATKVAAALKGKSTRGVTIAYDVSRFSGPALEPSWSPSYSSSGIIAPVSPLSVERGLLPGGAVVSDPAKTAANVFAGLLRDRGVTVSGAPTPGVAAGVTIASVNSQALSDIIGEMLSESDNFVAEVVARQVAIASHQPASFEGAASAIVAIVVKLGIPVAGVTMRDGSGLSRLDRLKPATLIAILQKAGTDARLSGLIPALAVAGFDGSLRDRFGRTPERLLGTVRAKTGTLTGVNTLAGIILTATGSPLIFVVLADKVPSADPTPPRAAIDRIVAAIAACRCTVGT